jgi:hypothetical protein
MLVLTRKIGKRVHIGTSVVVTVLAIEQAGCGWQLTPTPMLPSTGRRCGDACYGRFPRTKPIPRSFPDVPFGPINGR